MASTGLETAGHTSSVCFLLVKKLVLWYRYTLSPLVSLLSDSWWQGFPEKQNLFYRYEKIYYEKLVHTVVKVVKVPCSAVCKQETQGSQWCDSVWVQSLESQGKQWCKSQSEGKRRPMDVPAWMVIRRRGTFSLLLSFVLVGPSVNWLMPPTWGSKICFLESTN